MARRFTLVEAQRLIPRLEALLAEAAGLKTEYDEAEGAIRSSIERIMVMGGTVVDRDSARGARARLEAAASALHGAVDRIQELGCLVKDLDTGLVDFPTLFRGVEVYLCWKRGEPSIRFWHGVDEGFAGRKEIDREFRENHRGDAAH